MKNLHGVLHGMQSRMYHNLPDLCQSHLKEVGVTQNGETMTLQNRTTLDALELTA